MDGAHHLYRRWRGLDPLAATLAASLALTSLYVAAKAGRKVLHSLFPSAVPGETNTVLVASVVPSGKVASNEVGTLGEDEDVETYDYVIVGGGTASCVLANRLTEDPTVRVLMIEAGHSDTKQLLSRIPAGFAQLFKQAMCEWNITTAPQAKARGRSMYWPRGKMLGGCSAINAMIHQRGAPEDYDEWETRYGCEGWSYKDLLPYFIKSENFTDSPRHRLTNREHHGTKGPWQVSYSHIMDWSRDFVRACASIGIPTVNDINDPNTPMGATLCQTFISQDGQRSSTAVAYLTHDVASRPNLKIAVGQTVTRILFAPGGGEPRAVGVEMRSSRKTPITYRARAKREVLVTAGAVHTPQVLMCSGIGPAAELKKHDIKVVKDLPAVGQNLQDHLYTAVCATYSGLSLQHLASPIRSAGALIEWLRYGTGPMTSNVADAYCFVRAKDHGAPSTIEDHTSGPNAPDLELLSAAVAYINHGSVAPIPSTADYGTVGPIMLRPASRGTITLKSADPFEPTIVDPNYLSEESDRQMMVFGTRLAQKVMSTTPLVEGNLGWYEPKRLDQMSDAQVLGWVEDTCETIYHVVGSASMGPSPTNSVVDARLRVHGVRSLRVVDASIFPRIPGTHPCAVVVMTGEKAADMIKEDAKGAYGH